MKTLILTGANGFVGSEIQEICARQGFDAVCMSRDESGGWLREWDKLIRGKRLAGQAPTLVHLACPSERGSKSAWELYQQNSLELFQVARRDGLRSVLISSMSAHRANTSRYAKEKLRSEKIALQNDVGVARLGLVESRKFFSPFQLAILIEHLIGLERLIAPGANLFVTTTRDLEDLVRFLAQDENELGKHCVDFATPLSLPSVRRSLNSRKHHLTKMAAQVADTVASVTVFSEGRLVDSLLNLRHGMKSSVPLKQNFGVTSGSTPKLSRRGKALISTIALLLSLAILGVSFAFFQGVDDLFGIELSASAWTGLFVTAIASVLAGQVLMIRTRASFKLDVLAALVASLFSGIAIVILHLQPLADQKVTFGTLFLSVISSVIFLKRSAQRRQYR